MAAMAAMGTTSDSLQLLSRPIRELVKSINENKISKLDLLSAVAERLKASEGTNAFITTLPGEVNVDGNGAGSVAGKGGLSGIPIAVKDNFSTKV
jgi:Asp-tRNA(Asn)/Glu-tRNA(Gln) amidotransferase A subunit family amidase